MTGAQQHPRTSASRKLLAAALLALPALVVAQDGGVTGATSSSAAANYSCDNTTCVLPSCHCASTSPPGGLSPADVPQFITITADDAIQTYTVEVLNTLLSNRTNPNGCTPKATYFNSLAYNNYSLTTTAYSDWAWEIADHTMTHVGTPNSSEVLGNLKAINAFSGIPLSEIQGFRAPFLNYSTETLTMLAQNGFIYDSSSTSASPAGDAGTDAYFPYTLDNGLANDCFTAGLCNNGLSLKGFWEIPMYATFESDSATPVHLMDPQLDSTDAATVLGWLKTTFLQHYNGNRQPFGIYLHPIHLAINYPGVTDPIAMREMYVEFLNWVQTNSNVWFVTNQQLLAWMRNPVPASQMANQTWAQCQKPAVPATTKVCNGIEQNEAGLLLTCPFADYYWQTCYGCPTVEPTPDNPVPSQNTAIGVRSHISGNCSTAWFDPVANTCLCTGADCAFTDTARPVQNTSTAAATSGSGTATGSNPSATASGNTSAAGRTVAGFGGAVAGVVAAGVAVAGGALALLA